ncbi:MAG: cytidine deaminase [Acutalibacteraceae bacterium]|nr:cytidine deaminase [Oscillospiraceae bacterium]
MTSRELVELAKKAAENAYVPYSRHYVGAALEAKSGKVYLGCNIENAAYGPTNCAERTAFFKAISEGERGFSKIAVVGGKDLDFKTYFTPCGICRQVMSEFCDDDFIIILGKNGDEYIEKSLDEILPMRFSPKYLS